MRRAKSATCLILILLGVVPDIWAKNEAPSQRVAIDKILGMTSVIGGRESPKWSPDGSRIVFPSILNNGGLLSLSPDGGFPVRLPLEFSPGSRDPQFSPSGMWVSYISAKSGSPEIWLWSVSDGLEVQLTNLGGQINNTLSWSPDSRWIVFSGNRNGNFDIWKVAVPSGEIIRLTEDDREEVYPTWSPDSNKILYVRLDKRRVDHEIIEITAAGKNPRLIVPDTDFFDYGDYGPGWIFGYPFVSPDGKMVLFRSHRSGWINYWLAPLKGGPPRAIAAENADQNEARFSPDGKFIAYISNHNGTKDLRIVPVTGGAPRLLVTPEMGVCEDPEWSPCGSRISYTLSAYNRPKDLYIVDLKTGDQKQITFSLPLGGFEKTFVKPEKITFPGSDGVMIPAYLYKPSILRTGEKIPAIIIIHAGYKSGGHWQFDDSFLQQSNTSQQSVQFLVQNGYVVLQPNTRGSTGYGKEFEKANNGSFGHAELKDVLAGVEYLKSLPYVDPLKMGITGQSYGGTMTMLAATNAPGVFQAAVALSGFSDWLRGVTQEYPDDYVKMYEYELGPVKGNETLYQKLSPIHYVKNVTTPMLIIQGEGRGAIVQDSQLFVEQLRRFNKVFGYKSYPGEGYFVGREENRRQLELERLKFFNQFLKDRIGY